MEAISVIDTGGNRGYSKNTVQPVNTMEDIDNKHQVKIFIKSRRNNENDAITLNSDQELNMYGHTPKN
jgi:hypothetical protein